MAKPNVLIVEDEIISAKNTEEMLRELDYNVVGICVSGEEAVKMTFEEHPDLILMDIVLAGKIDGIDAAIEILSKMDVPIIFTTSYSDNETLKRAKGVSPYGYIIKPFQKKELLASIEIALERHILEQVNRQNKQLLETTLQSISDGIITTDKKGNILYINNIGEQVIGWPADKIKGKALCEILKISRNETNEDICKTIENPIHIKGIVKISSATLITLDGSSKIIEGSISPIRGKSGKITGFVLAFRDITKIDKTKRIQNTLYNISNAVNSASNIQELFESIREYLGEIIDTKNFYVALYDKETDTISLPYMIDEEKEFTSFPAGKTLTGYVIKHNKPMLVDEKLIKEMTKKGLFDNVGPQAKIWLGVPLRIEKEVIGVVAVQSYDNKDLYTKEDMNILEFVSGQLAIAISHKRAEDAQRIERAYFEQLFENSPEAIVLINNEGRIIRANSEFTKTFGYTFEEAYNKEIDKLLTRGRYCNEARQVTGKIAKGETVGLETVRWHKNGTPVYVSILGTPIIFEGGQLALYGIYRNISDRKMAEEALKKSEERYRELVENVHDIICRFDLKGIISYINAVGEKIFGLPSEKIVGKNIFDIVKTESKTQLKHFYQEQYLKKIQNTYHEFEIIKNTGEITWLGQNTSLISEDGKIVGFQAVARDITSRKKAEAALRQRTKDLDDRVKELNCLYRISDMVEDPDSSIDTILEKSIPIIAKAWQYPEITYVKIVYGLQEYKTRNYCETVWRISEDILAYKKILGTIEVGYLEEKPESYIGPFLKEESNLLHVIAEQLGRIAERKFAEDELKRANKKLEFLARTDPLTQLSNRRDVLEKIRYEKRRYGRNKKSFVIMICDIDDFKTINDTYGHDAGDEVLKTIANIMCMNVRKQDTVARWGGEEFLLLLPQTELKGGVILAEKIRKKVKSKEFKFFEKPLHITITTGVSAYNENKSIDEVINQADQALYMGKKLKKDCVKCERDLIK